MSYPNSLGGLTPDEYYNDNNPKCAGCGETENLTECRAIPDSTYHLCPVCKRDEELS